MTKRFNLFYSFCFVFDTVPRLGDKIVKRVEFLQTDALFDDICPENTVILFSCVRGTTSVNRVHKGSWLFEKFLNGLKAIKKVQNDVAVMDLIQKVQSNTNWLEEGEAEIRGGSSSCQHRLTRNFHLTLKDLKKKESPKRKK